MRRPTIYESSSSENSDERAESIGEERKTPPNLTKIESGNHKESKKDQRGS